MHPRFAHGTLVPRSRCQNAAAIGRGWVLMVVLILLGLVSTPATAGRIRLVAGEIDTGGAVSAAGAQPTDATGATDAAGAQDQKGGALVLIQLEGPVQEGWLEEIARPGVTIHHYLPDNAYMVTLSEPAPRSLSYARSLPHVSWAGWLPGGLKIHPVLAALTAQTASGASSRTYPRNDDVTVSILSVDGRVEKRIESMGLSPISSRKRRMGWYDTRVRVPKSRVDEIAEIWSVFHIEPQPHYLLHGERAAQTAAGNFAPGAATPSGPGYQAFLTANGLTGGAGLIAQVQDDGLDQGDISNLPGTAHPDIVGRIVGILNATSDPLGDSEAGHGQINAGIIMGNASVGTVDIEGYLLGQGVAPQASVYATKIFRNSGAFEIGTSTFTILAKNAQDAGAIVSNNSWGADLFGAYTTDAAEFDMLTRDADVVEAGHQPMAYFFSAGNAGSGAGSIGSPASAKNVITVGAAENSDANGTDGCGITPSGSDDLHDLIGFSSRGPNDDGRLGVTVVSVGTHNQGPTSTAPGYTGFGVCDQFWPVAQSDYARSSGTSHSSPTAAGVGLLIHEIFQSKLAPLGHTPTPSPALLKAVLTTTATDLAGGSDGAGGALTNVPNPKQGWGSVNLSNLLMMTQGLTTVDQTEVFTSSGQSFAIDVIPVDPTQPVKITLAWTDPPASPSANPALVNNLDLVVTDGASSYLGNVFSLGESVPGGGIPDSVNNLEAVFIRNPTLGQITVEVDATNIAGDALPGVGGSTEQDFALFIWNAVTQTNTGTLQFTRGVNCTDTGDIRLSDADLRGSGSQSVTVTTEAGDAETLSLSELGTAGVFLGSLTTSTSGVTTDDGVLQVSDDELATVTYDDLDDGTGSPAVVVDTVPVDCAGPEISNVQIGTVTSSAAVAIFDTSEAATGRVDYGLSCTDLTLENTGIGGLTAHSLSLSDLAQDTSYFMTVTATDSAGNTSTTDNGGSCFSFTTLPQPDYFTEMFGGDNDRANTSITLTPDGSADFYAACQTPAASAFPTDPTGGTLHSLADDAFVAIGLTGGRTVSLYGASHSSFFLGSNGFITFGTGDTEFFESLSDHFRLPRIAALFDDLDPSAGGTISSKQLSDRIAVTFENVPQFFGGDSDNSFQIEIFFDGRIRITHLEIDATDGLVGLSPGLGIPPDYVESDLGSYEMCDDSKGFVAMSPDPLLCGFPLEIYLGDGDLAGAGSVTADLISSSGDAETVTLTESLLGNGFFQSSLATLEDTATPGNDQLEVLQGDIVTASYNDADDGTGSPTVAIATVTAVCSNLGFELGDFTAWIPQDIASPLVALQVGGAGISPGFGFFVSAPTEGISAALHGFEGDGPGAIELAVDLSLPADPMSITFDYRAAWNLQSGGAIVDRTFFVDIEPVGGGSALQTDVILVAEAGSVNLDTGNLSDSVDVSAFAGQDVRLSFEWDIPENSSGPAFFQLDAVALSAPLPPPDDDADGTPDSADNCLNVFNPDQIDTDRDGFGNRCDPDVDGNGTVGIPDFNALRPAAGKSCGEVGYNENVDFDSNCVVGIPDATTMRRFFGLPPGPSGLACAGTVPCP